MTPHQESAALSRRPLQPPTANAQHSACTVRLRQAWEQELHGAQRSGAERRSEAQCAAEELWTAQCGGLSCSSAPLESAVLGII